MFKRSFDILFVLVILITTFPFLIIISLTNLFLEGRPIFYVSQRYVDSKKTISVYKFRTMINDATNPKYKINKLYLRDGFLKIPLDASVYTQFGRFLERYQIVEIPQFLNILFHRMSLIGNRPLPKKNVDQIKKFKDWDKRFLSPAGITGIAQICNSKDLTAKQRIELECLYSEVYLNGNVLKCDFYIILYTIRLIIFKKGLTLSKSKLLLQSCLN
jgi:lipopolysaccharide/colanic/teichoic acid biosynthesis glycosyltransferase